MLMILSALLSCQAIDGDTIRCGKEHIRLTAIDAPEMPGHCRQGRDCAPGDPFASKAALAADLSSGTVAIHRLETDHYGRTVADVYVDGRSLSCRQLAGGFARYWRRYDKGGRIRAECLLR